MYLLYFLIINVLFGISTQHQCCSDTGNNIAKQKVTERHPKEKPCKSTSILEDLIQHKLNFINYIFG